jgi:hypothetical protein
VVLPKGFEAAGDAPNGELLDDAPKELLDPNIGWLADHTTASKSETTCFLAQRCN